MLASGHDLPTLLRYLTLPYKLQLTGEGTSPPAPRITVSGLAAVVLHQLVKNHCMTPSLIADEDIS